MKRNASALLGATFVLPLLAGGVVHAALPDDSATPSSSSGASRLSEAQLDTITAGAYSVLPVLREPGPSCGPVEQPPIATTMAIGEEGGYYPYPVVLEPIQEPSLLTTMALGEEGGSFGSSM